MKLKEFTLWGFKLPLQDSRAFTLFSRSICAHYERNFQAIETENIYRVVLKLSETEERTGTTEESSSVLKYYKAFDFETHKKRDEISKKVELLELLHSSLLELCQIYSWPTHSFEHAYEVVSSENFINKYIYKRKTNKNRSLCAEIVCDHGVDLFCCELLISDKAGKIVVSKILFTEEPDEFLFNGRLCDIKWLDNDTLLVLRRDKSELERISLNNCFV